MDHQPEEDLRRQQGGRGLGSSQGSVLKKHLDVSCPKVALSYTGQCHRTIVIMKNVNLLVSYLEIYCT